VNVVKVNLTKAPPSQLLSALKGTNRQVIVRGSSSADNNLPTTAAVTILESPLPIPSSMTTTNQPALAGISAKPLPGMNEEEFSQKVFGISRFVQIAPKTVLMDLTVRLPPPARVGLAADGYNVYISSTGNMVDPPRTTGKSWLSLGKIVPDKDGYGDMFKEVDGELWEWIGKIFAGVVARSAGAWGNEKTVCACSGRTMWEEGREMDSKL
jgi:copper chaperone